MLTPATEVPFRDPPLIQHHFHTAHFSESGLLAKTTDGPMECALPLLTTRRLLALACASFLAIAAPANSRAQAIAAGPSSTASGRSAAATTNGAGPKGIVPLEQGFNLSAGATEQHDSSSGWATILTPDLAYRFNPIFSLDASVPIYADIQVHQNIGTKAKPIYTPVTKHGVPGDSSIAAQFAIQGSALSYTGTGTLGLPTGKTAYGLGAGKVTGDFNNHIEKDLDIFTPDLEFGIGNSTGLVRRRVRKNYASVGALAHFQAGSSIDLPRNISFDAEGYEELPLTTSTIYSVTGAGRKKSKNRTTNSAEDNGFTTSLDIPVGSHITFSGSFDRSVRTGDTIAGLSLTFLLKAPPSDTASE